MPLKDWVPQVRKALDQALAEHIVLTQSKLAQACPNDTGRMASSFYVGKDKPDFSTWPADWLNNAIRNIYLLFVLKECWFLQVEQSLE